MDLTGKNFDDADEVIDLPLLREEVVEVGGFVVGREVTEPGWRWSEHTMPVVGGEWCEARHVGVTVSGRWGVILPDGRTTTFGPGDVFEVPPGHDSWTIGDEPCVVIGWTGLRTFFASKALLPDRFLATILFVDIVGSTEAAARLGDGAWADFLHEFRQQVAAELERTNGREIKDTGDGFLAVFDGPGAAATCALAVRRVANARSVSIRAGIHVGEVESSGEDIRGLAVHEAARVMAAAGADEIFVSETTRALMQAPGQLEDRGTHDLKGIEGARRLFAYLSD
jgi:hypothetical protein